MRGRRVVWILAVLVALGVVGAAVAWRAVGGDGSAEGGRSDDGAIVAEGGTPGDAEVEAVAEPTDEERFGWAQSGAFDGEELVVVGNRRPVGGDGILGPHDRFVLDNGPWALDPATGTWRDLPPLGLDHPLVGASVHASRVGTIVVGTACGEDSPGFTDGVDGMDEQHGRPDLVCEPGTRAAAVRWAGEEAFEPLELPGDPEASAQVLGGGTSGGAYVLRDGDVHRLERDGSWTPLPTSPDQVVQLCPVGERLVALVAPERSDGEPGRSSRLAELAPGATAWTRVDPPVRGGLESLTCGNDVALLTTSSGGPGGAHALLRADGSRLAVGDPTFDAPSDPGDGTDVVRPPGRLGVAWWDGHGFVAESTGGLDLEAKVALPEEVFVLDPAGDAPGWRPAIGTIDLDRYDAVVPLDGVVALFRLQAPMGLDPLDEQEPATYEVAPVLRPG